MFREYKCGCIVSQFVGRVRMCQTHRPEKADGRGGLDSTAPIKGNSKKYPAFGQDVGGWSGK